MRTIRPFFLVLLCCLFFRNQLSAQCPYGLVDNTVLLQSGNGFNPVNFNFFFETISVCGLTAGETYNFSVCDENLPFESSINIYSSDGALLDWTGSECSLDIVAAEDGCVLLVVSDEDCSLSFVQSFTTLVQCSSCEEVTQLSATATNDAELIRDTFIGQGCFEILNMELNGPQGSIGTFAGGEAVLGMAGGVILATGDVQIVSGPNNDNGQWTNLDDGSDPDLATENADINDVVKIEFDFIPSADQAQFQYVFASEEYCDYTGSDYNDVFGFFISGPGINGQFQNGAENIALVPGTNEFVAINSVNHLSNSQYYVPNVRQAEIDEWDSCQGHPAPVALTGTEFDGFTTVLTATADLIACETYHIKIVIADVLDSAWDSAVFLAANSFNAGGGSTVSGIVPSTGTNQAYEGCSDGYFLFERSDEDLSEPLEIVYSINPASTATAGADYAELSGSTTIPAGEQTAAVPLIVYEDGMQEGVETIVIEYQIDCGCPGNVSGPLISAVIELIEAEPLVAVNETLVACESTPITIEAQSTGGHGSVNYLWPATGETTESISVSPVDGNIIEYRVTDACGYVANGSYTFAITDFIEVSVDTFACAGTSIELAGQILPAGSEYTDLASTAAGCDSTTYITVNSSPIYETTIDTLACSGEQIVINGLSLTAPSITQIELFSIDGCDSTVIVNLSEYPMQAPLQIDTAICANAELEILDSILLPNTSGSFVFEAASGCDSTVIVNVLSLEPLDLGIVDTSICDNSSIFIFDTELFAGSSQDFLLSGAEGCDSTVQVNVNIVEIPTGFVSDQACEGSSLNYFGQELLAGTSATFTVPSAMGCDSTVIIDVVAVSNFETQLDTAICLNTTLLFEGEEYSPSTSQSILYNSVLGCDSTLLLNVFGLPTSQAALDTFTCSGTSIQIAGETVAAGSSIELLDMNIHGCDSLTIVTVSEAEVYDLSLDTTACPGASVLIDGTSIVAGESALLSYQSTQGCDSLLTVSVQEIPIEFADLDTLICEGSSINLFGTPLSPGDAQDFTFISSGGCDSILTVTVQALPNSFASFDTIACAGSTVEIEGIAINAGSSQDLILTSALGCDSIVTVSVSAIEPVFSALDTFACEGSFLELANTQILAGGNATLALTAASGCDSILTVNVQAIEPSTGQIDSVACEGGSVQIEGIDIPAGETQEIMLTNSQGCDSLLVVTVDLVSVIFQDLPLQACEGSSVSFEGMEIAAGESEQFTYASALGCDSILTVIVSAVSNIESEFTDMLCEGEQINIQGEFFTAPANAELSLQSALGCDSTVTVTLDLIETIQTELDTFVCEGNSLTFEDEEFETGSEGQFTYIADSGCDSILTLRINAWPVFNTEVDTFACEGESLEFFGSQILAGNSENFLLQTIYNCDSLVSIFVEAKSAEQYEVNDATCLGESLLFDGQEVEAGSSTVFLYENVFGCDSSITFIVQALEPDSLSLDTAVCTGGSFIIDGQEILPGSEAEFAYTNSFGCDSIVSLSVEEVDILFTSQQFSLCEGASLDFEGLSMQPGDEQDFSYTSQLGCDSIVSVSILPLPKYNVSVDTAICAGSMLSIDGMLISAGETESLVYQTVDSCDSTVIYNVASLPDFSASLDTSICEGEIFNWQNNDYDSDTTASFTFQNIEGCDSIWTLNLNINSIALDFAAEDLSCYGEGDGSIEILDLDYPLDQYTMLLNGDTIPSSNLFENLLGGIYQIDIFDQNDCLFSESLELMEPPQVSVDAGPDQSIYPGESAQIEAIVAGEDLTIDWTPVQDLSCTDCPTPLASPSSTTVYEIQVTDSKDCSATDELTISILPPEENSVQIVNAFSPNGDGINDNFGPIIQGEVENYYFMVYDRWGKQIFYSNDPATRWDGTYQGERVELGVYVYYGEWIFTNSGELNKLKGNVTVVL